MQLSKRMDRLASMVTEGSSLADVGTDHGYIPIYEVLTGRAGYAYACDVAEGPLGRARDNVSLYNVGDRVQTVLSDGLKGLKNIKDNIPEVIVIAGISGNILAKLGRNEYISMQFVEKICGTLNCTIDEIMKFKESK